MQPVLSFKIVIIGSGGCGKSTLIKRMREDKFEPKYIATQGVDVVPLTFETNYGTIIFKCWDCAGQEKFGGLREGYYFHSQGAICMFDLTSMLSFNTLGSLIKSLKTITGDIPIVICGNKYDIENLKVNPLTLIPPEVNYYNISSRTNVNCDKPFLDLAKQLTGYEDLVFI
jgi:GTP-binding nuclear protein Ran